MKPFFRTAICDIAAGIATGLILTGSLQNPALAGPQGGTVVEGSARIEQSGSRVDIHQATDRAIINWRSFSIAPGETTQFHQPSAASIALNRVTGADPSHILGTLRANGQVFLVNPNGIMFGAGSRVDVSGLVATTSDIRNQDFMAGRMEFSIPSPNASASVINEGQITIAEAGYAALVAPHVRNSGIINARLGRVTLGAANTFAIDLYGDELVAFRVGVSRTPVDENGAPVKSLVANNGQILAGGGIIQLATSNVEAVVRNVINTDGVVYAGAIERQGGKIVLKAIGAGAVAVSGEVSAAGGSVDISGDGDVTLTDTNISAARVAITGDADLSGAGDLNAGPTGGDVMLTDAAIDASFAEGEGGQVAITGDRVALLGDTTIDASGASSGGEVLIGGNFQGKGSLRNADATIVGAQVKINADAGEAGDGGRVILWADGYTRFHGGISATGGMTGGDGGFVEVSGKQNLDFAGTVDLLAQAGAVGTLLLDPVDIIVSNADNTDAANGGTIAFADAPALEPWNVSPAALDGVGGNILLQATNDITINNAINLTTAGATFTATAQNNIDINEAITTNNAAITLTADSDGSGAGTLDIASNKDVISGGAAISITADDLALSGTLNSGAADTTILVSDGAIIDVGSNGAGMSISGGEVGKITAANLTIGDATNGSITVKGVSATNSNNIAGTVTLNATNAGASITFTAADSTFNALTANAENGITVLNSLSTDTGALTLNADSNGDGDGTFTSTVAETISTNNSAISITADDIALNGSLNSGAAATTLLISDGGTIGVGATAGNMTISGAELQNITATGLTIGDATNGKINVDGITAANSNNIAGTVTLNATQALQHVEFINNASTFNALTVNADDEIKVNVALTTDTGNLVLEGNASNATPHLHTNITFAAGVTVTSAGSLTLDGTTTGLAGLGALTLNAANGVTVNDNLTTVGATAIDADTDNNGTGTFTIAAAKTVDTTGNTLAITANKMDLAGFLNSGAQTTTLLASNGAAIDLGSATDVAGSTLELSNAELQSITASALTVGDGTAGAITVSADVTPGSTAGAGVTTFNLVTGSTVTGTAGGVVETNLSVTAAGAVNLTDATTDADILAVDTSTGNVTYTDADGFSVGTVGAVTGIDTDAGAVALTAITGNITVTNTAAANDIEATGTVALTASADNAAINIQATADVESTGGAHSYTADDIDIAGTITATGQTVTLKSTTAGDAIDVGDPGGGGDNVADTLELAGAEIQNVTAANLVIGNGSAGNMTVDGITAANSNNITGTVTLDATGAGSAITFQNVASTFNALAANADSGITTNIGLVTDTGGLAFSSANGVTFNNTVTTAGATTIDADSDDNGTGTFTLNNSLSTANNTLSVTADDVALNNTINTGAAAVTFLVSDGGTIGLGATAGNMTITGAELQNITATGLTIGDATNGTITVDGITAANSNNIAGTVTLNATQDNSSIAFSNTASTFNALTASADDRIAVNVDVTTDTGNLALDGDADNAADTNDDITFAAGATLTSAGALTLDATTGGMSGAGGLNLDAANGVTVNDSLTTAGATAIDADTDNNGTGSFTIAAAKTVDTTGNTLAITANKMDLAGFLNSGAQTTTLLASNGAAIDLGSATDVAGSTLELSNAELQSITASALTVGDGTAGAITVSADVTPGSTAGAGVTTVHLVTGSTVTGTAGGIVETNLSVTAAGAVTLTDATTDADTVAIDTSTGNIAYTDADGFTVGTAGGVTGIDTDAGTATLIATTGNITVANTAAANDIEASGAISLKASADNAAINIQAGADVESTGGAHSYTADDIEITGTVTATGQTVTLTSSTAGDAIDVGDPGGGGDNVANTLELAGTEIQSISAASLVIGDGSAGNMTVDGITAANSNNISGTVTLNATGNGSSIAFQNTASTFNALTASADNGIAVNVGLTTDIGNLALEGDADNAADGTDTVAFAAGVTTTSAGSITLDATTGGLTGAGALTLNADNGVALNDAFTGAGNTNVDADADSNSSGNFSATTLGFGANSLTVSGVNVNTGTSLTAGTTTMNGTVTGSGLNVASLTLTGASATLTGTTVAGQSGDDAAGVTTMPDAATHTVNGCEKSSCVQAAPPDPPALPPTDDIDSIQTDPGGSSGTDSPTGGSDSAGSGADDSTGGDAGSDTGGETGGDTGGDTAESAGGSTEDGTGGTGDVADGGDVSSGDWADSSFNPASGDAMLTESAGAVRGFFEMLKEEGAETLDLFEASENLDNPEIASLVEALGEILGEYDLVATAVPTNAFGDKAQTLLPGLLTFEPASAEDPNIIAEFGNYEPPSFGLFQF